MVAGPGNDDSLLVLVSVANEMQAALIVNTLEAHGIRATATGDFTSGFRAEGPAMYAYSSNGRICRKPAKCSRASVNCPTTLTVLSPRGVF